MKKFYLHVICCILFIATIIPANYGKAQENSSPVPQLYADEQNSGDLKMNLASVTADGNTLYINALKTWFSPPDVDSGVFPYNPTQNQSQRVIRVMDFSNPQNPVLIHDVNVDMGVSMDKIAISSGYFYALKGEIDNGPFTELPIGPPRQVANLSIFRIQDNEKLVQVKDMPFTSTLDSVRKDKNETFEIQQLIMTDKYVYIIFYGISLPEPVTYQAHPESGAYHSLPQAAGDTTDSGASAPPPPYTPPEDNTVIVTIDITDPSQAKVLGATRLNIAAIGGNMDLVVSGNNGYLIASAVDGKDATIYSLDLSSPGNISIINSLNIYGQGGQLVKEGNRLYVAAQDFGLEIIDISDPLALKLIGSIETPHPFSGTMEVSMGGYRNIVVKDGYVYLLDNQKGLLVLDASDPSNPKQVASYLTKYLSASMFGYLPSGYYVSVESCGDYLFLRDMRSIEIISIANPLSPTLVGLLGERECMIIEITLSLKAAELLDFHTEQRGEGNIALFGIPSLDTLNRKYGVYKIEQPGMYPYPANYWLDQPLPKDYNYPVEDIKKERRLRKFYITFPASPDIAALVADYQKDPYVIAADEIDIDELLRFAAPTHGVPGGPAYGASGPSGGEMLPYGVVEDKTPPEDATDFAATAGDEKISLSWTPSANTAQDLFAQLLYIDSGDGYGDPIQLGIGVKTYELSDVTNGTTYTIKLTAIDSHHNESEGVTATAKPKASKKAQTAPSLFQLPLWAAGSQPIIQIMPTIIQIGNPGLGNGWGNTINNGWNNGLGIGLGNGLGNGRNNNFGFSLGSGWGW